VHDPGYEPDQYDYRQYEDNLKQYFLHSPSSRAAFLRGGLAWRLAHEVLGNDLEGFALSGPSETACYQGVQFSIDNSSVWDDQLSPEDTSFIAGMIPILTGE
jgi:hypothetical protein